MCGAGYSKMTSTILGSFSNFMDAAQKEEQEAFEMKTLKKRNDIEKQELIEKTNLKKGNSKTQFAANGIDIASQTTKDVADDIDSQISKEISYIDDNFATYNKKQELKKKSKTQNLLFPNNI
ncbi:MAG: hypothetical protein ACRCV3_02265 [Desulfovibrionaceae bacterium]